MMLFVHASPTTLEPYRCKNLGVLSSPRRYYRSTENVESWRWAADNDAYGAWDETRYRQMLESIWGLRGCAFVTAPDVVGDATATLELFEVWYDDLNTILQPIALVAQDGLEPTDVPWHRIAALFVGGTSEWKLGEAARRLVDEALIREKWVHMGRVNTYQRIRYAKAIGCHSVDGTNFSKYRDLKLPGALKAVAAPVQGIFDVVAVR